MIMHVVFGLAVFSLAYASYWIGHHDGRTDILRSIHRSVSAMRTEVDKTS